MLTLDVFHLTMRYRFGHQLLEIRDDFDKFQILTELARNKEIQ